MKDSIWLYGMATAAIPKKSDPKTVSVICTPIAVVDGNIREFQTLYDLKFNHEFNLLDTRQIIDFYIRWVNTLEAVVQRQEASCLHRYREVALDIGQDSRHPANFNAIYMQIFGERFSPPLTHDEILLRELQEIGDLEEWDSFETQMSKFVDDLFTPLALKDSDSKVIESMIDLLFPAEGRDPELRARIRTSIAEEMLKDLAAQRIPKIESSIRLLNEILGEHLGAELTIEETENLSSLKQKLVTAITAKYPNEPDKFDALVQEAGIGLSYDYKLNQRRFYLQHLGISYPGSYIAVIANARHEQEVILAERARAEFIEQNGIPDELIQAHAKLARLIKQCTLREGNYSPPVDPFTPGKYVKENCRTLKPDYLDERIIRAKRELDHGDIAGHYELIEIAKEQGRVFGKRQNTEIDSFAYTAPAGYAENLALQKRVPRLAFYHWDTDYRDAFYEGFDDEYLGPYNVHLKLPMDPPNPPFTDPCAWRIGDQFKIVGNMRCADGVENREEWQGRIISSARQGAARAR